MARKNRKEEYCRFFSVAEPRTHEKGYTEYKITARFVSKKRPEDVKEVVVWRRYSELKKLHGELAYTHRNLFRRQEDFPPFPRAQLFGRFDEAVIEERRQAAEAMLLFTTSIPALYNSPQLKEFFRGGEVQRPLEQCSLSLSTPLPPPLIPLPKGHSGLEVEEETGQEAPIQTQELESTLVEKELGDPEVAVEALGNIEISPVEEKLDEEAQYKVSTDQSATDTYPKPPGSSFEHVNDQSEEFDLLFDGVLEEHVDVTPPLLSDKDLAIFDPCAKNDHTSGSPDHSELLSLRLVSEDSTGCSKKTGYVAQANSELIAAQQKEKEEDYGAAVLKYRSAVDILMKGVQGEVDPQQRDAVKKKIAECLEYAERLLSSQTPTHPHNT